MKTFILSLGLLMAISAASAQPLNTYREWRSLDFVDVSYTQQTDNQKWSLSTSYGIVLMTDMLSGATATLTAGYTVAPKMRISAMGSVQIIGDINSYWSLAAMFGTTEIFANPYSRSFTEWSFGVGYMQKSDYYYDEYWDNRYTEGGFFFPLRLKWGYQLTQNMDIGLDLMGAFGTTRGTSWLLQGGIFFGVRW